MYYTLPVLHVFLVRPALYDLGLTFGPCHKVPLRCNQVAL
jgi:hypothetical protein